jgi:hypothetical protein
MIDPWNTMQLENIIKDTNKANKKDTASQCRAISTVLESRLNRFNNALETTRSQCAASYISQIVNPITWAAQLERENSGFSM